jgi:hypothetical protein
MGMRFPIPLLLSIAVKFSDKEAKLALRASESWAARFMITAAHRSGRAERHFGLLAFRVHSEKITTAEDLAREVETIIAPDSLFVEKFRAKTLPNERQVRFVLLELEAPVRADDRDAFAVAVDEPDRLNLEHVLPKSKDWAKHYPKFTTDERNGCISKIGNLALRKRETNSALNDAPFAVKLPLLSASSIKTTEVIPSYAIEGEWTPQAIDNRQVWLSEIALKRWPLFSARKQKGRVR